MEANAEEMMTMPTRTILVLMLSLLVLPAFAQDDIDQLRTKAEQGDAAAQTALGVRYAEGRGVPQDDKEAVRWYRLAADQGYANAQNNLGLMYEEGQGVPQNRSQAHIWFNLAASDLIGEDRERAVRNRDRVAKEMTSEQIAEAQRLAREWKPGSIDYAEALVPDIEPCELPSAADYSAAAEELIDSPQGFVENLINFGRRSARGRIAQYEACVRSRK